MAESEKNGGVTVIDKSEGTWPDFVGQVGNDIEGNGRHALGALRPDDAAALPPGLIERSLAEHSPATREDDLSSMEAQLESLRDELARVTFEQGIQLAKIRDAERIGQASHPDAERKLRELNDRMAEIGRAIQRLDRKIQARQ